MRAAPISFPKLLWVILPASLVGCTIYPPRISNYPTQISPLQVQAMQKQHGELVARFQELNTRAASLDADNQRLQALLAQQQQQTAQMQTALRGSRDTVADLRKDLVEARQAPPSYAGQGDLPTAEVGYAPQGGLPLASISGADVDHDGSDIRIRLDGSQLYASGKASIKNTSSNSKLLDDLATAIRSSYPNRRITVEGHTDSDPIRRSRWKNNDELSLARAKAVYEALRRRGVLEQQLSIAGFGATRPLADDRTTAGKARNRRVEIVIHSQRVN